MRMAISVLRRSSDRRKSEDQQAVDRRHLVLAGLSQKIFLSQWGTPEIRINLDKTEGYPPEAAIPSGPSMEDVLHSVWIYLKQDRVFFFTQKKLVSHFKWSAFKEKGRGVEHVNSLPVHVPKSAFASLTQAISLAS